MAVTVPNFERNEAGELIGVPTTLTVDDAGNVYDANGNYVGRAGEIYVDMDGNAVNPAGQIVGYAAPAR